MVLTWLKNLLFSPKRLEFLELADRVYVNERRLMRLEGTAGVDKRDNAKAERSAEFETAAAEAMLMLQEGKPYKEIAAAIAVKHPLIALRMAQQFGLKL